jgi:glycolate oxidase FAD binding subunit
MQNANCKLQIINCRLSNLQFAFCNLHFAISFLSQLAMALLTDSAPFVETIAASEQDGVVEAVRAAYDARRPVYPIGGGTAQDYGIATSRPGVDLNLSGLSKIVDYTPRDMTVLVEAGVRTADLARALAAEGQQLPIDVPRAGEATIGGVVATNWNGSRRYGYGTVRDYVIGIHAVDGRGVAFKGGGRVVKNVAGYDFCKLLCGSLGTLSVITQLALKVKPLPEQSATILAQCTDLGVADSILGRLAQLEAPPIAIDLLVGAAWRAEIVHHPARFDSNHIAIVVRVEGTETEVAWLAEQVQFELWTGGAAAVERLDASVADTLWKRQVEFSDRGPHETPDGSPMVLKIAVPASATISIVTRILDADPNCTIQARAGNGIIVARFAQFSHADLTRVLVANLRPAAIKLGGSAVVVSSKLEGLTPHVVWGGRTEAIMLLERIKHKFDPQNILNRGRFVV